MSTISNDLWYDWRIVIIAWQDFVKDSSTRWWSVSEAEAHVILSWNRAVYKTNTQARVLFAEVGDAKAARALVELMKEERYKALEAIWCSDGGTPAAFAALVSRGEIEI